MDRCGEIFLCELCKGGRGKIARNVARFSKAIMSGRKWLRGTFVMCVVWTFAQFTVGAFPGLVQEFYREPEVSRYTLVGTLSRIGFMPSPLLLGSDLAQMSVLVAALLALLFQASGREREQHAFGDGLGLDQVLALDEGRQRKAGIVESEVGRLSQSAAP